MSHEPKHEPNHAQKSHKRRRVLIAALGVLTAAFSTAVSAHGPAHHPVARYGHVVHHPVRVTHYRPAPVVRYARPAVVHRTVVVQQPVPYYAPQPVYYSTGPAITIGVQVPPIVIPLR